MKKMEIKFLPGNSCSFWRLFLACKGWPQGWLRREEKLVCYIRSLIFKFVYSVNRKLGDVLRKVTD